MLTRHTKSAIQAYSRALAVEGAKDRAKQLDRLCAVFYGFATKQLQEFLDLLKQLEKRDAAAEPKPLAQPAVTIGELLPSLRRLEAFLRKISSTARANELKALHGTLSELESYKLEELICAVKVLRLGKPKGRPMDFHQQLAKRLKAALGNESEFSEAFAQLEQLDARGVALVTEALMRGGSAKSRKVDLSRIRERHESLAIDGARRRATAGRSAA